MAGTLMGLNFYAIYKIRNHTLIGTPANVLWTLGVE